ncbi:MAG TPA: glycosyltransferase [Candidatus Ozemobacteraceae bacterium]
MMSGPFRLLFVVTSLAAGGAERSLLSLCDELAARGHRVTLVSLQERNDFSDEMPSGIRWTSLLPGHVRLRRGLLFCLRRLCQEAAAHDLVVAGMEGLPCLVGGFAARNAGKPFIAWIHTMLAGHAREEWGWAFTQLHRLLLRLSDGVVGVSQGVVDGMREFVPGLQDGLCEVIYNIKNTMPREGAATASRKSEAGVPTVLTAGRIRLHLKGYDVLVEAHQRLVRAGIAHRLVIVGDGPDRPRLLGMIRQAGLEGTIVCPGFDPRIEEWLAKADLFVLSSRREGLPRTLLEAMAAGVPIVASDCPSGPRELLLDGRCGRLVTPGDPAALADAIQETLASSEIRQGYVRHSLVRIRDFSPECVVPRWEALFARLLSRTPR